MCLPWLHLLPIRVVNVASVSEQLGLLALYTGKASRCSSCDLQPQILQQNLSLLAYAHCDYCASCCAAQLSLLGLARQPCLQDALAHYLYILPLHSTLKFYLDSHVFAVCHGLSPAPLHIDDIKGQRLADSGERSYVIAKTMLLMSTRELARRLEGSGVDVMAGETQSSA